MSRAGSLTILNGKPVILYDCYNIPDCLPPNKTQASAAAVRAAAGLGAPTRVRVGDPPHVGVARPADSSDANLTVWEKDPNNPIAFPGMRGGAYEQPSPFFLCTCVCVCVCACVSEPTVPRRRPACLPGRCLCALSWRCTQDGVMTALAAHVCACGLGGCRVCRAVQPLAGGWQGQHGDGPGPLHGEV